MHTKLSCSWSNPYVHVRLQADFSVFTPIRVACKLEISENESSQKSSYQLQIKFRGGWPRQHWHFQVGKERKLHTNHVVAGRIRTVRIKPKVFTPICVAWAWCPRKQIFPEEQLSVIIKNWTNNSTLFDSFAPKGLNKIGQRAKRLETSSQEISYAWVIGICHLNSWTSGSSGKDVIFAPFLPGIIAFTHAHLVNFWACAHMRSTNRKPEFGIRFWIIPEVKTRGLCWPKRSWALGTRLANDARNYAQKGCAMQFNGITLND